MCYEVILDLTTCLQRLVRCLRWPELPWVNIVDRVAVETDDVSGVEELVARLFRIGECEFDVLLSWVVIVLHHIMREVDDAS